MALYERPNASHLPLLFRLGFSARLRWELSDTYITTTPTLSPTKDRAASTLFHFQTNDTPAQATSLLTTVQTHLAFLTLTPRPGQSSTPTLLRVTFASNPTPTRTLVSLQRPGPAGKYLTLLDDAAALTDSYSKHCLFHLEIAPDSIGKGPEYAPQDLQFLYPVQAFTSTLLSLSVRFRLRSTHKRVLRTQKDGTRSVVVQDGPRTRLAEAYDEELIVTGYKVAKNAPDADKEPRALFKLVDAASERSLVVADASVTKGDVQTAAVLGDGQVCMQWTSNWGGVNVGNANGTEWLMAGRRGRLEVRGHRGNWEEFVVEFVKQSLDMTIKEVPKSNVFQEASEVTRKAVREQIARSVAVAKGVETKAVMSDESNKVVESKKEGDKRGSSGFNHAAALGGLSEPVKKVKEEVKSEKKVEKDDGVNEKERKAMAAASAAMAVSGLPRNKANRKAAKRNKKKQAKQTQKAALKTKTVKPAASDAKAEPYANGNMSGQNSTESNSAPTPAPTDADRGTASQSTAESIGPPCAACGRIVEGTYTTALSKNFHPQCFCCGHCRRPMGVSAGQFRERGGIPYCESCYTAHLAARCARCTKPILETVITAMDKTWHKECLTCTICRLPLTQTFWLYADKPNEPRCSRCVTGSEDGLGHVRGNGRMVNLPMFGMGQGRQTMPLGSSGIGAAPSGSAGQPGRARLMAPVLPASTRR